MLFLCLDFAAQKILTANNLMKRRWTDDPMCKLCGIDHETPIHLCKVCPYTKEVWDNITPMQGSYTKEVWDNIKVWFNLTDLSTVSTNGSLHNFWQKYRRNVDKSQRRSFDWNPNLLLVEYMEREE
jgi:hypothetical protein